MLTAVVTRCAICLARGPSSMLKNTCSHAPRLTNMRLASSRKDRLNSPRRKRGAGRARELFFLDMAEAARDLKQVATRNQCLPACVLEEPEHAVDGMLHACLLRITGRRQARRRSRDPIPSE